MQSKFVTSLLKMHNWVPMLSWLSDVVFWHLILSKQTVLCVKKHNCFPKVLSADSLKRNWILCRLTYIVTVWWNLIFHGEKCIIVGPLVLFCFSKLSLTDFHFHSLCRVSRLLDLSEGKIQCFFLLNYCLNIRAPLSLMLSSRAVLWKWPFITCRCGYTATFFTSLKHLSFSRAISCFVSCFQLSPYVCVWMLRHFPEKNIESLVEMFCVSIRGPISQ